MAVLRNGERLAGSIRSPFAFLLAYIGSHRPIRQKRIFCRTQRFIAQKAVAT
ncbi:hypothetical protein BURKHO8Y_110200 [Burkholderia sp. 8Y]|nr:hypothetical protein BURKHO8Y_110200 [Burkholderia sp. 8Y]